MRRPALTELALQHRTEPKATGNFVDNVNEVQSETPEREIARLTEIRTGLAAQLVPLEQAKADALLNRRNLLLTGTADETATVEANRTCRERESDWFAVSDAIAEADRRLADAIGRRDAAALAVERERVATGLERNAGDIETATAVLSKALSALVGAHATLAVATSGTAALQFAPHTGVDSPVKVANAVLMQGLVATLTGAGIEVQIRDMSDHSFMLPVEPADPVASVAAFGDRLREIARQVRSGETGVDLPAHHQPEPDFTPDSPEVEVYVLAPFHYVGAQRQRVMVSTAKASLPVPVAERAIEMGVASDVPTRQWQNAQKSHGTLTDPHQRTGGLGWDQCHDIGFDLADWRRDETRRRRDAWLAGQSREAA